ncbi:MAG: hypothetical protein WKG00_09980 [Polyangiaceae bacterium]
MAASLAATASASATDDTAGGAGAEGGAAHADGPASAAKSAISCHRDKARISAGADPMAPV